MPQRTGRRAVVRLYRRGNAHNCGETTMLDQDAVVFCRAPRLDGPADDGTVLICSRVHADALE
jgi:hypothetical protein